MTCPLTSSALLQLPPPASFLGTPPELRGSIYNLVAAQTETIIRNLSPEETAVTVAYEPMLLVCKQVSDEFLCHIHLFETLRCDFNEKEWPSWGPQKIDEKLVDILGPFLDNVRVLKTSLKADDSNLWYFVDRLPVLQGLHLRLHDEDFDFRLDRKYLSSTAQKRLYTLAAPYFQPTSSMIWLMANLKNWAGQPPFDERRRILDQEAQRILDQQVRRGLKVFSYIDLYTLPVCCKEIVIKHKQKLRQKWDVVLDGVSGKVISRTLGELCWRDLSYFEQMMLDFSRSRSQSKTASFAMDDSAGTSSNISTDITSPPDPVWTRYTNLVKRKNPRMDGSKQAGKQLRGRLTYLKDRNLQARML